MDTTKIWKSLAAFFMAMYAGLLGAEAKSCMFSELLDFSEITLGVNENARPFSFYDGFKYSGFMVELCKKAIVVGLGDDCEVDVSFEYRSVNQANQFSSLRKGEIDLICTPLTHSISRRIDERIQFSNTVFVTGADFLTRRNIRIRDFADLRGLRISVLSQTTTINGISSAISDAGFSNEIELVTVSSHEQGVALLTSQQVDAHVGDQVLLMPFLTLHPQLRLTGNIHSFEPYAFGLREDDIKLAKLVDLGLSRIFRTGEIWTVMERHLPNSQPGSLLISAYILGGVPE